MPTETRQVPAEALRFEAGRFEFEETESGNTRIRMLARSGQPIEHWYWGRIVHDMSGMKLSKERIPIDYRHRSDEVIGFLDEFDTSSNDLQVAGELVSFKEDDRAAEVGYKGKNGVPYESSINFNGDGIKIEELGIGAVAKVNGYSFEGPGVIVREWPLRGVAVTPYGADMHTRSEFSGDEETVAVHVFSQEKSSMAKTETTPTAKPEPKPAELEKTGEETPETKPETQPETTELEKPQPKTEPATSETAEDPRTQFNAELKRFNEAFGHNGATWFAEGKTYEQALELHNAELSKRLEAEQREKTELQQRLASLDRGEDEPAEFQDAGKPDSVTKETKELQSKLGDGLGRFAAGMKLPQPSLN